MASEEELLAKHTHKGPGTTTAQRVFYVLKGDRDAPDGSPVKQITLDQANSWLHRISVLMGYVIEQMENEGALPEKQLDDMLYEAASKRG